MSQETVSLLMNLMLFVPGLGVALLLLAPAKYAKYLAFGITLVSLALAGLVYYYYRHYNVPENLNNGYLFHTAYRWFGQVGENGQWVSRYDIKFVTGVDGISIYLVLLTALLFPLSVWASWGSVTKNERGYYSMLLLLQVGVYGVFMSLDLFLFYVFFELGLIPMYFLIGLWGGKDRIYAAVKFFLYTLFGSLLMLVAILWLGGYVGHALIGPEAFTTDLVTITSYLREHALEPSTQKWLFWAFALSFLIKVPVFPLHTWLPAAHVQAPTAGSVILAGVLLKMGTYGLLRFNLPLFPDASSYYAGIMAMLGVIGILYGAMAAMVQSDIKKLVAYSSVAHMGFIIMGIFSFNAEATSGAVLQMINHGISTGALFLIVGMIYDRRHTREISDFQGIAKQLPVFTLLFMITTLSSIGLPGLNGFVGEFLILVGSFKSDAFADAYVIVATAGVIVAAVYMLWMFRRVMFGELDKQENRELTDLSGREVAILMPLVVLMFVIGFWATPFLQEISKTSDIVIRDVLGALGSVPISAR